MKTKNAKKPDAELTINRAIDDPHGLARSWLAGLEGRGHGVRVVHHRDEYLRWDGAEYYEIPAGDLRKQLAAHAERQFVRANKKELKAWADRAEAGAKPPIMKKVTTRLITDVLQALSSECHLPSDIGPPTWITGAGTIDEERAADEDPRMVMAMPSGVLNLLKAADEDPDCFGPPTPHFFTRAAVGYDYSASATAPRWTQFLNEVFGVTEDANDEKSKKANKAAKASIRALRQWFGYLLTADTSLQKILMLLGLPRSGKGTILRVLSALLGETNVGSVRLEDLGSPNTTAARSRSIQAPACAPSFRTAPRLAKAGANAAKASRRMPCRRSSLSSRPAAGIEPRTRTPRRWLRAPGLLCRST